MASVQRGSAGKWKWQRSIYEIIYIYYVSWRYLAIDSEAQSIMNSAELEH